MAELDGQQENAVSTDNPREQSSDNDSSAKVDSSRRVVSSKSASSGSAKRLSNVRSSPRIPKLQKNQGRGSTPKSSTPLRSSKLSKKQNPGSRGSTTAIKKPTGSVRPKSKRESNPAIVARSGSTRVVRSSPIKESAGSIDAAQMRKRLGIEKQANLSPHSVNPKPRDQPLGTDQSTMISDVSAEGLWKARQAIELFERGKVSKAMTLYQAGMSVNPGLDAKALYLSLSGYRSLVKGQPGKALKDLEQAVELLPQCTELDPLERADVQYRLADICEQTRNVVTGLEAIRACIDLLVDLEDTARLRRALAAKGRLHYLMRQYEKSYESFEMALSCEGSDPEAWKLHHGIAKCYEKQGEKDKAKKAYEASRRSVMNKARDKFDKLVSNSGQSLLIVGGGTKKQGESQKLKPKQDKEAEGAEESSEDVTPKKSTKGPEPQLRARIAESVRLKRPVVSEAYPREELLKSIDAGSESKASESSVKSPVVPKTIPQIPKGVVSNFTKNFSKPSLNVDFKPVKKADAGQETVALPAYDVSAPSRTRMSRTSLLLWSIGGIPGVIGLFLLGLYFGHSTNKREIVGNEAEVKAQERIVEAERQKNQALNDQIAKSNALMHNSIQSLQLQLSKSQLVGGQLGEAANSIAQAQNSLKLMISDGKIKPSVVAHRNTKTIDIARQIVNRGPWSWNSIATQNEQDIRQLSVSADGQIISVLDKQGGVQFFSSLTGQKLSLLADRRTHFVKGCWITSPENGLGQRLVGISEKGAWNCIATLKGSSERFIANNIGSNIKDIVLTVSGRRLVTLYETGAFQVWSLGTAQSLGPSFELSEQTKFFGALPSEQHLIVVAKNESILLVDINGSVKKSISTPHAETIQSLTLSADNQFALTLSKDGLAIVWALGNDEIVEHSRHWIPKVNTGQIALWHNAGKLRLATGNSKGLVTIYRYETEWLNETKFQHGSKAISALKFLPHGETVISGSNKSIRLWRISADIQQSSFEALSQTQMTVPVDRVLFLSGRIPYAIVCFKDKRVGIKYWNNGQWKDLGGEISKAAKQKLISQPTTAFDGQKIAWLRDPVHIDLWTLQGATRPATIASDSELLAISFLGHSDKILAATKSGSLVIFDEAGTILPVTPAKPGVRGNVVRIISSSTGATALIQYESGAVRLWRAGAARNLETLLPSSTQTDCSFSPDGQVIAIRGESTKLELWSLSFDGKLKRLKSWNNLRPGFQYCFTPDSSAVLMFQDDTLLVKNIENNDVWFESKFPAKTVQAMVVSGPKLCHLSPEGQLRMYRLSLPVFSPRLFQANPIDYMNQFTGQ